MAAKVDQALLARMRKLKETCNGEGGKLNNEQIAKRLGVTSRTVRAYLNGHMTPADAPDVSSTGH